MSASLSGTRMASLIKEEGSRASSKAGSVHGSAAQMEAVQVSLTKMTTVPGSGDVRSNQGSARSSVYSLKDGEVELTPLTFLLDEVVQQGEHLIFLGFYNMVITPQKFVSSGRCHEFNDCLWGNWKF